MEILIKLSTRKIGTVLSWQWVSTVLVGGLLIAAALSHRWPFTSALSTADYPKPTLWQLILTDRFTLGLLRVALVVLGAYVVMSVPALVIAGRWIKGFGKDGLTVDDRLEAKKTISGLQEDFSTTAEKLAEATAQARKLTEERDQAKDIARDLISRLGGDTS